MADSLKVILGSRIQAARKRARLSQEALAGRIGRTPESISNIERGQQLPGIDTLIELARALDTSVMVFIEGLDQPRELTPDRARQEAEHIEVIRSLSSAGLRIATEQVKVLKAVK